MDIPLPEPVPGVTSREAQRFAWVDEQGWDESCGYAALASLLGRYRGLPTTESDLLGTDAGPGQTVKRVSLAALAHAARSRGLTFDAWRARWDDLPALTASATPLLVHYDRPRPHFALLLSVGPRGAVTADPARGLELLGRDQFLARWSGVVCRVVDPARPGAGRSEAEAAAASALARGRLLDPPGP